MREFKVGIEWNGRGCRKLRVDSLGGEAKGSKCATAAGACSYMAAAAIVTSAITGDKFKRVSSEKRRKCQSSNLKEVPDWLNNGWKKITRT